MSKLAYRRPTEGRWPTLGEMIDRNLRVVFLAEHRAGGAAHGNVWYMGENSLERRHDHLVRASDSWKSGVNGAEPGIIMRGHPRRGDVYRQEFLPAGQALDQARVLGRRASLTVPAGTFRNVLVTIEWSPTEPQFEKKYYARGVGEIAERVVQGGHEQFQLVSVTR